MPTSVRMLFLVPALILVPLLFSSPLLAADRSEAGGDGWRTGEAGSRPLSHGARTATGLGLLSRQEPDQARAYLQAYQTAKMDALRNLLMQVDNIRIDSNTEGVDFSLKEDTIRAELKGKLRGARVVSERIVTMGNGRLLELTVSISSSGEEPTREAPRPVRRPQIQNSAPLPEPPAYRPQPPLPPRYEPPRRTRASGYTSVIIDARGLNIERSMSPRIRRANGSPIWGNVEVDPDWVIAHGIVSYAHSMREAENSARAGANPLVLQAVGRGGGHYPSDPVLSNADATCLLQANDESGFLEKFHVIFIVDAGK